MSVPQIHRYDLNFHQVHDNSSLAMPLVSIPSPVLRYSACKYRGPWNSIARKRLIDIDSYSRIARLRHMSAKKTSDQNIGPLPYTLPVS